MTRDDIIRMAREAGWQEDMFGIGIWDSKELNVFANLVAAAEREECAALCDKHTRPIDDPLARVGLYDSGCYTTAEFLADAIRARGAP